jgi:hypothetical protein
LSSEPKTISVGNALRKAAKGKLYGVCNRPEGKT